MANEPALVDQAFDYTLVLSVAVSVAFQAFGRWLNCKP